MSAQNNKPEKNSRKKYSGVLIPAGLLIGLGVGFAIDNVVSSLFIGLGIGFLCFAIIMMVGRSE